jgi:hypothetical protein
MEDDIWAWEDSIAEHEAEILNEVAMFGDSGPGSAVQLRESRQGLAELKARYNTLYPAAPVVLPAPVPVNPLAEDIPF